MKLPADLAFRVGVVGRNDPDEAESIVRSAVAALGYCPSQVAHYLIMLQNDPSDLQRRIAGLEIRTPSGHAAPC